MLHFSKTHKGMISKFDDKNTDNEYIQKIMSLAILAS